MASNRLTSSGLKIFSSSSETLAEINSQLVLAEISLEIVKDPTLLVAIITVLVVYFLARKKDN